MIPLILLQKLTTDSEAGETMEARSSSMSTTTDGAGMVAGSIPFGEAAGAGMPDGAGTAGVPDGVGTPGAGAAGVGTPGAGTAGVPDGVGMQAGAGPVGAGAAAGAGTIAGDIRTTTPVATTGAATEGVADIPIPQSQLIRFEDVPI